MNRLQKIQWFNIIVIFATIIITTTVIMIEIAIKGHSSLGLYFLAIPVLLKFNRLLLKKLPSRDKVVLDERDIDITKRAAAITYKIFWFVFIFVCFTIFLIIGPRNSVPVITLPLIAVGGGFFMRIICSVSILILYGRGDKNHE